MRKKNFGFVVALLAVVIVSTVMAFQPSTVSAVPKKSDAQMDLMIELGTGPSGKPMSVQELTRLISNIGSSGQDGFRVDSFFDIHYVANIGSNGLDGFSVDSFFDISYEVDRSSPGGFDTEMVALSLRSTLDNADNTAAILDAVKAAVEKTGGDVYYGQITVLK